MFSIIYPLTADECRKKWNDLRFGVQRYRENAKRTGAGPVKEPDNLYDIEKILGEKSAHINGIPECCSSGEPEKLIEIKADIPSTSNDVNIWG